MNGPVPVTAVTLRISSVPPAPIEMRVSAGIDAPTLIDVAPAADDADSDVATVEISVTADL